MSLLVERASALMSVQDLGRAGFARFGLPESGPMDWWAQRAANRLVGNPADTACLEVGFTGAFLRVDADALLACLWSGLSGMGQSTPDPSLGGLPGPKRGPGAAGEGCRWELGVFVRSRRPGYAGLDGLAQRQPPGRFGLFSG